MADPQQPKPRIETARRDQLEWRSFDLDALLPADHRARLVWAVIEEMDFELFYAAIAARGSVPGRPALDPRVLLALWVYATSEGIGSARRLALLCERDQVYQWICGGLRPNYHSLSDFRVDHGSKLEGLLSQVLAALMTVGVLKLERVSQDGVRVRANAGAASFRRGSTLRERNLAEAEAQVAALRQELDANPNAATTQEAAARERVAKDRLSRVQKALEELPKLEATHKRNQKPGKRRESNRTPASKKNEPRVSTTDPEARVMKMGDGGFRPAYNLQFASDNKTGLIVGFEVSNSGSDNSLMEPMIDRVIERTGERPVEWLVDGGYTKLDAIDAVEKAGTQVLAPVPRPRKEGVDPYSRKEKDTDHTFAWRTRMATAEAQAIYRERAPTAERIHADMRAWRGLQRLPVRGKVKVKAVGLLMALAHNIIHSPRLLCAA